MSTAAEDGTQNETVQTTTADHIMVITINRPRTRNAIDTRAATGIAAALDRLDADPEVRIAILTGAGGTFCSGMDLKEFATSGGNVADHGGRGFAGITGQPPRKPIIAAVEGYALAGGFEIALACDLIVAARGAIFGLPEVSRGLLPGAGGLFRLPAVIARNVAMELALTGARLGAERAHDLGLVNMLTKSGEALPAARRLAQQICANAPLAVDAAKAVINATHWPDPAWALDRQAAYLSRVSASSDALEGARAFAERRAPVWRGQ